MLYLLQRVQGWLPLNPMGFGTAHHGSHSARLHDAGPGV